MRTHKELKGLLGAYAVDAVDVDERRAIQDHLATCEACREEVTHHLETLALMTDEEEVPHSVWRSIVGSLDEAPQQTRVELLRPSRRRWFPPRLSFALGAAALFLFAVMGVRLVEQQRSIRTIQASLGSKAIETLSERAAEDPDAVVVTMQSPDKSKMARVVVLPDGRGYVLSDNLDPLDSEQTYQLWALRGEERISLGILGTDPEIAAFRSVGGASGFAITVEKRGGVPATANSPVVFGFTSS